MTWADTSALAPAGPQAARLAHVTWMFLLVCAGVYVVMMILFFGALALARTRGHVRDAGASARPFDEHRRLRLVAAGGGLTAAVLVGLLVGTARAGHGLNPLVGATDALRVRVVGRQWWWQFEYPGDAPDERVTTANELHIPVGRPVLLELVSRDVIHSFWVPALHGKRDLIPGHDSTTYIEADHAGIFRGQCAEFCGAQHAKMGFLVIAQPPRDFEGWLAQQRQPARPDVDAAAARGRQVFLSGSCPMCHAIMGTTAGATMGPDLTHLRSRATLGAGSVPNARAHLAAWIADAQAVKPGNHMPPVPLPTGQLDDLVTFLETLR